MGNCCAKRQSLDEESIDFEKYVENLNMPSVDSYYTKIKSNIKAYCSWEETIQKYKKIIPQNTNDKDHHKSFEQIDNELIQNMNKTEQAI